ncbi:DUF805 domain-containing protein [Convivina praedatoris]|uniref:Inner membrane protein YhaI n=1 Tax=Convivina praedatoris TaxID=2880963 RepID=A0ABM9D4L5_9LACO|nr:DUF805 domain-containing protein [Convivina sp. LMG 32447]CAH1854612.1 Inner membrane protein YhaI [Convivina sp. LMG 32447]CAH1857049.1 Inner membrane protein YhaI [Convivina sp. LMG 32447]CAH1857480.1 Inner membrane protein YhaI [Convivina sp. LMG 32447]
MIESYRRFWQNILNFSGTASRSDFWWPTIINYFLGVLLVSIVTKNSGHSIETIYNLTDLSVNLVAKVIALVVWLGNLSVKVRRLHDSDHSGWWIFIQFLPIFGEIWLIILLLFSSKRNRWQ